MNRKRSRASRKPAGPKSIPPKTSQDKSACSNSACNNSAKRVLKNEFDPKRRGELSELAFMYKAASLGFHVAKPYGESERYDFILDAGHRLWRVQVKSTSTFLNGFYRIGAYRCSNRRVIAYRPGEVDFIVGHVIPEDAWFVLPISLVENRTSVYFPARDHSPRHSLIAPYREAWHLLREP